MTSELINEGILFIRVADLPSVIDLLSNLRHVAGLPFKFLDRVFDLLVHQSLVWLKSDYPAATKTLSIVS